MFFVTILWRGLQLYSFSGKTVFIAPVQEELSPAPLPLSDESFRNMPKPTCHNCGEAIPLPLLTEHIKSSNIEDAGSDDTLATVDTTERKCNTQNYVYFFIM